MNPVQLSEAAVTGIIRLRTDKGLTENQYLRIGIKIGGCAGYAYYVGFDNPKENDVQFNQDNVLMTVDKVHLEYIKGLTIDYKDQDYGGFTFVNPQAKRVCGCGTSFNTKDLEEKFITEDCTTI